MMELLAYLAVGLLLLAFLRHVVYRKVRRGEMSPWIGALLAGSVWGSIPIILVILAGSELQPAIVIASALLFTSAAVTVIVGSRMARAR